MRPRIVTVVLAIGLVVQATAVAAQDRPADQGDMFRYNNRGMAFLEQYDFQGAVDEFQKALRLEPDFVPARVNLGISHYYLADYTKAAQQFRIVLKLNPSQPHAHFMLGLITAKERERTEAFSHFQAVLATDQDDPATHYNLGLLHARNRDYQAAIVSFQKVLELERHHVSALYNLAMTYMRSGRPEESRQTMRRFQELKSGDQAGGPMGAMGVQYAEEGKYALGIGQYDPPAQTTPNTVRFSDITAAANITFKHAGTAQNPIGRRINRAEYSREWAERTLVPALGSGAAFLDYDRDGNLDVLIVNTGGSGHVLYRNAGGGKFKDVTAQSGLKPGQAGMGVAVGDYNNDGFDDLFITGYGGNTLYRNEKNGAFLDVTTQAAIPNFSGQWSLSAAFFDYDHDGDLDIYVTNFVDLDTPPDRDILTFPDDFQGQPNQLLRNNGNGAFQDVADQAQVSGGKAKSTTVVFLDYNNSRDIDFIVFNYGSGPNLFSNRRNGTFEDVSRQSGMAVPSPFGAAAGDLNKDSYEDLVTPAGFYRNTVGSRFAPVKTPVSTDETVSAWSTLAFDYDNDGWLDTLVVGKDCRLLKNLGAKGFSDVSAQAGLSGLPTAAARSATIADYDNDGDNDLLVVNNGGSPLLLRNEGGNLNKSIRINLSGLRDNKNGLGAKIEVRAGQSWQKLEANGYCGFLSQGSGGIVFGLGTRNLADSLRILWPTGVLQAELDRRAGAGERIEEVDRKGTSCPLLYAWNGIRYDFVTDFLGGSAVGYLVAPGTYGATDPDEYIKIADVAPQPKNGRYSFKVNNQLEEVMFIDEVKLLAVDHPEYTSVFPDEKLMPAPPFPPFKVFVTKASRPPLAAWDENGHDVLSTLLEVDRRYPDTFKLLPFKGYAQTHELILDPGDLSRSRKTVLLMTAWIDYADSSSNLAAWQSGARLIPPYLQVLDQQGNWVTALDSIGFPAGLPKTMTLDLTGKFLNDKDFRIKIVTNMRIYWDQILVDTFDGPVDLRVTTLEADVANLSFYGYPREIRPDGKLPPRYDYQDRELAAPWKNHKGRYTRYGDVRPLLGSKDDRYAIMRHGDEITVEFKQNRLPALPAGQVRTFLLYAAGFGKDMDLNSADADTVAPLPSHSGTAPDGRAHREYLRKYNTREILETF